MTVAGKSLPAVAVGDYAACTGTTGFDVDVVVPGAPTVSQNGAFQAAKGIRFEEITDGLTNTLLVGEKHLTPALYGQYPWDWSLYDGHNPASSQRGAGPNFPLAASNSDLGWKFGSRHVGLCQFAFCDGTVRSLSTSIDPFVLGLLAQRNDNQPIPDY